MTPTQKQLRLELNLDGVYGVHPFAMRPPCVHCGEVPIGRGFHNGPNGLECDVCLHDPKFTIDVLFRPSAVWGLVLHGAKVA